MWLIKDLVESATAKDDKMKDPTREGENESQIATLCPSIEVKGPSFQPFFPMRRCALPELHTLLGTCSEALNYFWDFMQDRIEVLPKTLVEN